METINELLSTLRQVGIKLWVEGDRLRYSAPPGTLTAELRDQLVHHKLDIIKFLQEANLTSNSQDEVIVKIPRTENLPLSFAQQRLWFLDQLEGSNASYNMPGALKLQGKLNFTALEKSVAAIVERHEILRTNFNILEGNPIQVIHPEVKVFIPINNLENLSTQAKETEVKNLINQETETPFDLQKDALLRLNIIKLSEDEHILLITMHHIISDGWSIGIFIRELSILYQSYCQNKSPQVPELPFQYADFSAWQRKYLSGERLEQKLTYWNNKLQGIPPLLELPTDYQRPPVKTFRGDHKYFQLSHQLSNKIKQYSQNIEATLFMTLLSIFSILMSRYSRQEDITIGSPIANRNHQEIESLIGFFVNTLVIRCDLSGNPSLTQLITRIKQICLKAYHHQDVPFEKLVEVLQPERNLSYSPLFQVMFVLQNASNEKLELSELTVTSMENEFNLSKFDLTLSMEETEEQISGAINYNTDLFSSSTIERMIGHFEVLVETLITNPHTPINQCSLLTGSEKQQILFDWNNTTAEYPKDKCIHQLFEEQVERTPDAVAVVYEEQQLTYQELNQKSNQLAHYLQNLGVKPDTLVGISVERSLEMVIGLLGILKAGGAYVPIDPNYPEERVKYLLEDSAVSILLTQEKLIDKLPQTEAKRICLERDWSMIAQEDDQRLSSQVNPKNLAYVIYTSGSTGKPKGVLIEHQGLCNLSQAQIQSLHLHPSSRVLQFASFSFDASVSEIFMALCSGARLCLVEKDSLLPGEPLQQVIQKYSITHITLPPSALIVMSPEVLGGVETIVVAGEACQPEIAAKWSKGRRFLNGYGPSEDTVCATIGQYQAERGKFSIGKPLPNQQVYLLDPNLQPVPIGVPGELHIGGVGLARGYLNRPNLTAERFINNPFSDAPNSRLYKTGDLALYLPDGNIEYLGRIDNQVKIRGFRIELGEIEAILASHPEVKEGVVIAREDTPGNKRLVAYFTSSLIPERLPYHTECQVEIEGQTHRITTQDFSSNGMRLTGVSWTIPEGTRVKLFFKLPSDDNPCWLSGTVVWSRESDFGVQFQLDPETAQQVNQSFEYLMEQENIREIAQRTLNQELRNYLKKKLPDYMIPSIFILLESFSRTPNGKINRRGLPIPSLYHQNATENYLPPRDRLEQELTQLWTGLLEISPIGLNDNFFELGGHSLLAVRLMAEIQKNYGKHLPLATLFEKPTINQLADFIRSDVAQVSWSSLVGIQPKGDKPRFFCIPGAGGNVIYLYELARYLGKDQPFYGLQSVGLDGISQPYQTVEEMAAHYIKDIQKIQPQGPYYLGGHSFGGAVAFEMALQLQKNNQEIGLLGIIDADIALNDDQSNQDDTTIIVKIAQFIGSLVKIDLNITYEQLAPLHPEEQLRYLKGRMEQVNFLPPSEDLQAVRGLLQVYKANYNTHYLPQNILKSPIHLFFARESLEANNTSKPVNDDIIKNWQRWTTFPLQVDWVPGNHLSMLTSPHVGVLAQLLKQKLGQ